MIEEIKSNNGGLKEEKINRLERSGFQRIEGTDYLKGEGFLIYVGPDGWIKNLTVLSEGDNYGTYDNFTNGKFSVADIQIREHREEGKLQRLSLVVISPDGYEMSGGIISGGRSSGGTGKEVEPVPDIKKHLIEQGFKRLTSDEGGGIFQFTAPEGQKAILKLSGDQLNYVGVDGNNPLPREDLLFSTGTRVVDYSKPLVKSEFGSAREIPTLHLENNILSYKVEFPGSSKGLKDIRFKVPITDKLFPQIISGWLFGLQEP